MKRFVVCKTCGARVSGLLDSPVALDFITKAEQELLSGGEYGNGDNGNVYISTSDKHHLSYHQDQNRLIGCCGPSPYGLPNLVCICKSEIGREVTDCCTAHYVMLYKERIAIREDNTGLLEKVVSLPVAEDLKSQYEILINFGEIEIVLNALKM
ncbi:hypothetical protein [Chitinophaga pinensis]|uniref:Uncharacterized protein n=1 Tax=Chitinophaga pinensis (strain ATCC 43595 / DSM 2588 / LMG 13176 / NBRC 15968 / NCIMB 11800 / UQM 2034) TaxID=485918 RepID=A0A979GQQ3_CHIPD|nr:hypothetical protein [Chitinophaga pinensis]ACU61747.1 hypothetical protein Cpin_4298 [Chitinophaga pinensis DSM 2588]